MTSFIFITFLINRRVMLIGSLPTEEVGNSIFNTHMSFVALSLLILFRQVFGVNLGHFTGGAAPAVARVLFVHVFDLLILICVQVLS